MIDRQSSVLRRSTTVIEERASNLFGVVESNPVPSIYNSSRMQCIFETGYMEAGSFHHASFEAERENGEWNGAASEVDPWESVQRLARKPRRTLQQYEHSKFKKFTNVDTPGRAMEPLEDNRKGVDPAPLAPRTWVIGATMRFLNAHERSPAGLSQTARVSPAGTFR